MESTHCSGLVHVFEAYLKKGSYLPMVLMTNCESSRFEDGSCHRFTISEDPSFEILVGKEVFDIK